MTNAVEAVIGTDGVVRLLEPLKVSKPQRAWVLLVPEPVNESAAVFDDRPEAEVERRAALAEFRATGQGGMTTPEAIGLFLSLVGEKGGK
jgi:hypothetical protein